jgi:predicted nucleotidyltransferase component of viral defense system
MGGGRLMLSREQVLREAAASGFQSEPLEKAVYLLELLELLHTHPFLKGRLVLKGGTALNLFLFDLPRLSVDIDLNYIGAVDRATMLQEKPKLEKAVQAVCGRLGIQIKRVPGDHAGGKWRLSHPSALGRPGTMELDLNMLLRTPLWPPVVMDSRPVGSFTARQVPVLDLHELAAGKLAALFSRSASRDLFDVYNLLREPSLDMKRLRLGFLVYGGANRRDWRTIGIEDIQVDPADAERQLVPMLRADLTPDRSVMRGWTEDLVQQCRNLISRLLPLRPQEVEFLTRLNAHGEIAPECLTGDEKMQAIIGSHPALLWKALNVRNYFGEGGKKDELPFDAGEVKEG